MVRKSTDVAKDGHDNTAPEELRIGGSEERKGFGLVTFLFFTPTFPLVNLRHVADLKDRINSILRGSCCLTCRFNAACSPPTSCFWVKATTPKILLLELFGCI